MDKELLFFVNEVFAKTGIKIAIFYKGLPVAGETAVNETVLEKVREIVLDTEKNRTLFNVKNNNKEYVCRINGATTTERNFAFFISQLAENYFFKEEELSVEDFYKEVLLGELSYSQLRKYASKYSVPDMECFVMLLNVPSKDLLDVKTILEEYTAGSLDYSLKLNETQCALIKFVDEESYEYQSSTEYAEFLLRSIQEETGANVKIYIGGTVKSIYDLSSSYSQATSAISLSNAINAKGNVHSFKEYLLIRILEDMPRYRLSEYLDTLMEINAGEIFSDEEMINTAEEFLENNLNVSETSRKLYLHRNTLMYRLDKIEKLTGLNLRKFSDAVTFRLITALIKLVK